MSAMRRVLLAALRVICVVLFTALVVIVVWQVFTRLVLGSPSVWTSVTAQYMFVWLGLFALTLVFGERGHIAVVFFAELCPAGMQRAFQLLVQLATIFFAAVAMVWGGLRGMAISWDQTIPGFAFSVGQAYLALPIAGALIILLAAEDLLRVARGQDLVPIATEDDEVETTATSVGVGSSHTPGAAPPPDDAGDTQPADAQRKER
ncbi:MAG: TRAP transporter small permease [Brachybacterium sp.]|nr:TRAP transporter small permease [Brachybacterium sp.]